MQLFPHRMAGDMFKTFTQLPPLASIFTHPNTIKYSFQSSRDTWIHLKTILSLIPFKMRVGTSPFPMRPPPFRDAVPKILGFCGWRPLSYAWIKSDLYKNFQESSIFTYQDDLWCQRWPQSSSLQSENLNASDLIEKSI